MFQKSALRLLNVHRGLILALSLSAAAGWVSFAISRHSLAEMEHQLRKQVESMQAIRSQLLAETTKAQASLSGVAQLRGELETAQKEINRLSQSREQTVADRPRAKPDTRGANLRPNDVNDDVSTTGSIGEKTNKAQKDKAGSVKLPEKQPRNPQVAAVGIAIQGTQKPAERPQRGNALTVVSKLDTAALRQLTKSAGAPVQ
ncbi:hypothetical protein [Microvirga calopogonii]|uniref:hypothetical protein n=1 Tax=Microvirga calopogonii TaxID=2078013 RepID=UPI000E0CBFF1|nr:hypothetical protein [Microvirga calopogonii]